MRFTKFGKTLSMGVLSAGIIFGVTSCVESYTVGFLYVTGTVTASSGNSGIISGYRIDHNVGTLAPIDGLPVSSGGANPVRAVLTLGSRFLFVLNRGVNNAGNGNCYGVGTAECQNANVTEYAVGGNGILTPQETFFTQGQNPFRLIVDSSGSYLLVLDHDAPDNSNPTANDNCARALGGGVTTCGDVTIFQINSTTGRLSLVVNAQVTAANGSPLTYFPVPANPVDFVLNGQYLLTLTGGPAPTSYPYTGGTSVWPYSYSTSNGQLTLSQNGLQPLVAGNTSGGSSPMKAGNAIVNGNGTMYVLDNEPLTVICTTGTCAFPAGTYPGQILPFTVASGGALQAVTSGIFPDASSLANPIQLLVDSKNKYVYVANQGNNISGNNPESGIAGYDFYNAPSVQLQFIAEQPFGSGSGPQCIVEDPSSQYVYEANEYDSTVTGRTLDPDTGDLNPMRSTETWTLQGQPTWCLVDGRTG